ncbi:MAG: Uma2 family endonuclease [Bacteroidetes bacterium]|nr:Uma2 family endonuclease [Bacteroidota bacterium]
MEAVYETQEQIKRRKKSMGSKNHSGIQYSLIIQLAFKYHNIYKTIPELSLEIDGNEKIPDLSIYKNFNIIPGNDETKVTDLPLGVIEILSPTQRLSELVAKSRLYFDAGISSYWLVIPEVRSIYVYSEKEKYKVYTYEDTLIDKKLNIELELAKVFE